MFEIVMGIDDFLIQLVKYCRWIKPMKTDEIDEMSSTIYRSNGDVEVKDATHRVGMGLVGCDKSILHTNKHIKRKENIEIESNEVINMSATMQAVKEHFMLASDVKGHKVVNKNAEDLGKIDDYILDLETGRIAYAVLLQNTNIYMEVYKTWIATLENLALNSKEISEQTTDPKAYENFYTLWAKMYEKAIDSFFEDMPIPSQMKELMEPIKIMAKTYSMAKLYSETVSSGKKAEDEIRTGSRYGSNPIRY